MELLVFLKKSAIQHKDGEKSVFSGRLMGFEVMIGYYSGSLVYYDLCGQEQLKKPYGEGVIAVILEQLSKWAFKNPDTLVDRRDFDRTAWIVTGSFCCILDISNNRYLLGDRMPDIARKNKIQVRIVYNLY